MKSTHRLEMLVEHTPNQTRPVAVFTTDWQDVKIAVVTSCRLSICQNDLQQGSQPHKLCGGDALSGQVFAAHLKGFYSLFDLLCCRLHALSRCLFFGGLCKL